MKVANLVLMGKQRIDYIRCPPHVSLGDQTPEEFTEAFQKAG